jgi:hypothetical protein
MAKKGRYSNETKAQAELFINMLDGNIDDAHDMAFERSEMFWEEVADGERDEDDAQKATILTNYLGHLTRKK